MTATILPPIGSVWFRTLYPDRIYIVIAHDTKSRFGKYGAIQVRRMDTGSVSTEPVKSFTWHYSPLETMETQ